MCPFSAYVGMLTGLFLYQPYAGNYSCFELVGITSLPYPEDIVLQQCSPSSDSYHPPFFMSPEPCRERCDIVSLCD